MGLKLSIGQQEVVIPLLGMEMEKNRKAVNQLTRRMFLCSADLLYSISSNAGCSACKFCSIYSFKEEITEVADNIGDNTSQGMICYVTSL